MCIDRKDFGSRQRIVDVWAHNLEDEFEKMLKVVERGNFGFVAIDTEFPGVVITNSASKRYTELRCNVDALNIIQLGMAFSDSGGQCPPDVPVWQFNFSFDVQKDLHATESIELLQHAGLDFRKHHQMGIDPRRFGELLMQSGMVLSDQFHWICFHGCYDFAYLIKVLTGAELPNSLAELLELLDLFFPQRGDVKLLAKPLGNFGSLLSIAEQRGLQCNGVHQGGLDALLTRDVFFSFPEVVKSTAWSGDVFGLEEDVDTSEPQEWETPPQEWPQRTRYLEAPRTPPEQQQQQQQQYGLSSLAASPNPHQYSPPQQQYNNHHNQYRDNGYYGYNQRQNYTNQYVQQDNYAYNRGYAHHNWQQRDYQYRRPNVPAY